MNNLKFRPLFTFTRLNVGRSRYKSILAKVCGNSALQSHGERWFFRAGNGPARKPSWEYPSTSIHLGQVTASDSMCPSVLKRAGFSARYSSTQHQRSAAQLISQSFLLSCGHDLRLSWRQRIYLPHHTLPKADINMCLDFLTAGFLAKEECAESPGYCGKGPAGKGIAKDIVTPRGPAC